MSDLQNSAPTEHRQDGSPWRHVDNLIRDAANAATLESADKIAGTLNGIVHTALHGGSIRENISRNIDAEKELTRQAREADPYFTAAGRVTGFGLSIVSGLEAVQAIREFYMLHGGLRAAGMVAVRSTLGLSGVRGVVTVNNAVGGMRSVQPAVQDAYQLVVEGLSSPSTPKISRSVGANIHHP